MKRLFAVTLVVCMLFCSVACSAKPITEHVPKEDNGEVVGTEAVNTGSGFRDTIVVGMASDVTSMDPHVGKETAAVAVTCNIFSPLVYCTDDLQIVPSVAESWKQLDDTVWEFTIRDDIYFHDGNKLTVEDVKYSMDRAIESAYVSYIVDFISEVSIVNDNTITITTKAPYAPILMNLSHPSVAIVPKLATETESALEAFKLHPIGSGPYKFIEWKQGEHVKLEAFDKYFGNQPKTKKLLIKIIPEGSQRTIGLETGELDLAYDILVNDIEKVRSSDLLKLYEAPSLTAWYMSMNNNRPILNNKLVRQAIRHAIDNQLIVDTILCGAGEVAHSVIPPLAFGFVQDEKGYPYDIEKAKQLLAQAGYPNGFDLELMVNDNQTRVEICQVIQGLLKDIGINVSIKVMEYASFFEASNRGEHESAFYLWTDVTADADYSYYSLLHSSQQGPPGNRSFFSNPEADRLIDEAKASSNPEQRKGLYKQLESILHEESPNAVIFYSSIVVGGREAVEGFVVNPSGYHKLHTTLVKE